MVPDFDNANVGVEADFDPDWEIPYVRHNYRQQPSQRPLERFDRRPKRRPQRVAAPSARATRQPPGPSASATYGYSTDAPAMMAPIPQAHLLPWPYPVPTMIAPFEPQISLPWNYSYFPGIPTPSPGIYVCSTAPLPPPTVPPPAPVPTELCKCIYTEATVNIFKIERVEVIQSDLEASLFFRRLRSPNCALPCLLVDPAMEKPFQAFYKSQILEERDTLLHPPNETLPIQEIVATLDDTNYLLMGDMDKLSSLFKCLGQYGDEVDMVIVLKGNYRDIRGELLPNASPTGPKFMESLIGVIRHADVLTQFQELLDDPNNSFCICEARNAQAEVQNSEPQVPQPPNTHPYYL